MPSARFLPVAYVLVVGTVFVMAGWPTTVTVAITLFAGLWVGFLVGTGYARTHQQ